MTFLFARRRQQNIQFGTENPFLSRHRAPRTYCARNIVVTRVITEKEAVQYSLFRILLQTHKVTPFEQYPHNPTIACTVVHRTISETFPPAAADPLFAYISVSM